MSRRAVLLATGGAVLAACASDGPTAGSSQSGHFTSRYRAGARTGWTILYPPGHSSARSRRGLPVLVALHGRTGSHTDAYRKLHLDEVLGHLVNRGTAPFAIASVDGGDHDYWHPRRDTDPAGMVLREFLPLLAAHGLDIGRPGFLGWSMGGYGALYLATVLGAARCGVAVSASAAIWHRADQVVEGSFDDAADFRSHALWSRLPRLAGIPLRIDCGAADGFAPVVRDLQARLHPTPAGGIEPGGHDSNYWRRMAPAELAFAASHLA